MVGAGKVAARKLVPLVDCGAEVTLVTGCAGPPTWQVPAGVEMVCQDYGPQMLADALLVLACTDDREVNDRIAADARQAGALVNVADQPDDCDFFMPAIARDGPVVVAVGTGGAAPALAGELRDKFAKTMPPQTGQFAELLAELREQLKRDVSQAGHRHRIMKRLSTAEVMELYITGGAEAVSELAEQLIAAIEC